MCQTRYTMQRKAITAPNKNTLSTELSRFVKSTLVITDPRKIPASNAINMVPAPIQRRFSGDKSAVQAKMVGELIPVATPNNTAESVNQSVLCEKPITTMLMVSTIIPISNVSLLQILSDTFPANNRIPMVDKTYHKKNQPLSGICRKSAISGESTKMIPEQIADRNMMIATGLTCRSMISSDLMSKCLT